MIWDANDNPTDEEFDRAIDRLFEIASDDSSNPVITTKIRSYLEVIPGCQNEHSLKWFTICLLMGIIIGREKYERSSKLM